MMKSTQQKILVRLLKVSPTTGKIGALSAAETVFISGVRQPP